MIRVTSKGDWSKTRKFLAKAKDFNIRDILVEYAEKGVQALSGATPQDTGLTASSWGYDISVKKYESRITWTNSNIVDGVPIAVILQYGHGTGTGGYVEGVDYINPALRPIFEELANQAWKEVTK